MQYLLATAFDLPVGILYSSASERIQVLAEIDHDKLPCNPKNTNSGSLMCSQLVP